MRAPSAFLALLALAGCGYVGAPLPPALNIPQRITDLAAVQRGEEIVLRFTPSLMSADDLQLKQLQAFDVRVAPKGEGDFDLWRWAAAAERFSFPFEKAETVEHRLPAARWTGQEIVIAAASIGPTGKRSDWSNLQVLTIIPPLPRPSQLAFKPDAKGVFLTWRSQPLPERTGWRVWRSSEETPEPALLGVATEPSWFDATAIVGRQYSYWVQAARLEGERPPESSPSEILSVAFRDEFPPAPPSGLTAIAGLNAIELAWERNTESDLAGYQVYRAAAGGPFEKLGPAVTLPAASDPAAEPGILYRYAVSALDSAGNESKPCAPVEIAGPPKN